MQMTVLYSILHLLVDGACAMAMFGTFIPQDSGYFYILVYNFCAFALQMPFGVVLDALHAKEEGRDGDVSLENAKAGKKNGDLDAITAALGVVCTIAGAVTHPVLLGIGNALFHVGGGVGTIRDDRIGMPHEGGGERKNRLITRLGVFVAPGALGLYLGTLLTQNGGWKLWFWAGSVLLLTLCGGMLYFCLRRSAGVSVFTETGGARGRGQSRAPMRFRYEGRSLPERVEPEERNRLPERVEPAAWSGLRLTVCCLIVVILRSYIGMAVLFSWKTGVLAGSLSVLAVAGGKMAGGFLSAWKGSLRTAAVSLIMAAVCYLLSASMPFGLAALFLFNMTMPITLYWMICAFPRMPGFAFGCLTFALFLGFLPVYFGVRPFAAGNVIGGAGSMLSLLLLAAGIGKGGRGEKRSD